MSTDPKPISKQRIKIAGIVAMAIGILVVFFTRSVPGVEGILWIVIALLLVGAGLAAIIAGSKKDK